MCTETIKTRSQVCEYPGSQFFCRMNSGLNALGRIRLIYFICRTDSRIV